MRYAYGVLVFLAGMLVQWWWSTYFSVFGVAPQILLVLTVAIAAHAGPVPGQCFGFAWGLFLDAIGVHLFGSNALALTLGGYLVGMGRRQMDVSSPLSQLMAVGVGTLVYFLFLALLGVVFQGRAFAGGWTALLLCPLINALVAPLIFPFVERSIHL